MMMKLNIEECLKILNGIKLVPFRRYRDHVYFYWHPLFRLGWKEMFVFEKDGAPYAFMYCVGDTLNICVKSDQVDVYHMIDIAKGFWDFTCGLVVDIQVV